MAFDPSYNVQPVSIANAGTTSAAVQIPNGLTPVGFITPGTLTSTAMTFQVSVDDSTYVAMKTNDGSASISYTVAASGYYPLNPADWAGVSYMKFVAGSSEGGARIIQLICRPV